MKFMKNIFKPVIIASCFVFFAMMPSQLNALCPNPTECGCNQHIGGGVMMNYYWFTCNGDCPNPDNGFSFVTTTWFGNEINSGYMGADLASAICQTSVF